MAAAYDGAIRISTKIDTKGIETGTKSVESGLSKLKSGLLGFTAAFAGVAVAVGAFAKTGIDYEAQMEQYTTSFEVMTGSAEEASKIVEELKEKAAATPFEMPDLAETTQLLMNYGLTADDAMGKMSMLGDISQGSADKLKRIAMAYGQMSSAGKVQLEDVKQMIEAGFNPLQEISQSTGESMSSLYDRISKGTISVDEITASMERSTSAGGKYFQSMEKQSKTLNGVISTFKDTFNQFAGSIMEKLLPVATSFIQKMSDLMEKFSKLNPAVQNFILVLAGIVIVAGPALMAIGSIANGVKAIISLISAIAPIIEAIVAALTGPIGLIIAAIAALIAIIVLVVKYWDDIKAAAQNALNAIQSAWGNFAGWIQTNIIAPITGFFSNLWNSISSAASAALNAIQSVWGSISGWFSSNVIAPIQSTFQALSSWFETLFSGIVMIIEAVWVTVSQWFNDNVITPLMNAFSPIVNEIGDFFSKLWNDISSIWNAASQWFESRVITPLSNGFSSMIDSVSEFFSRLWASVTSIWGSVAQWFSGNVTTPLVAAFNAAISAIKSAFETVFNAIGNFVKGIFNGFIASVENMINAIVNALNKLISGFNSAATWAANVLGTSWGGLPSISSVSLPRLAKGAVIPPNREFLAVLGDQKSGTNIEAPLSTMVDAFNQALDARGSSTSGMQRIELIVKAGSGFVRNLSIELDKESKRRGVSLVKGM